MSNENKKENKYYKPLFGDFAGQIGIMIGRVANPSHNDIRLVFQSGDCRWYKFSDVTAHQPEPEPEPVQNLDMDSYKSEFFKHFPLSPNKVYSYYRKKSD